MRVNAQPSVAGFLPTGEDTTFILHHPTSQTWGKEQRGQGGHPPGPTEGTAAGWQP